MTKTPTLIDVLQTSPKLDRAPTARGLFSDGGDPHEDKPVDREGGSRKSGIIRGASIIERGEALGHDLWIDELTLDQVVEFGNATDGLKVRFTHPSMSGDGLGSYLGRARDLWRDGDRVFGDVHFSPTSRSTPDGDLGEYVMSLAEDDPESFGMSIVFDHDFGAEAKFIEENRNEDGFFESPEDGNEYGFPHVRLAALKGVDFVDSPAANPNGLFHRGPTANILKQSEGLIEYLIGLSDEAPEDTGGLSAERLKGFFSRFLDGRGIALQVVSKKEKLTMSKKRDVKLDDDPKKDDVETTDEAPENGPEAEDKKKKAATEDEKETVETAESEESEVEEEETVETFSRVDVEKFSSKFGAEKGMKYLLDGVSFEEALSKEFDLLAAKNKVVGDDGRGEEEPVGTFGGEPNGRDGFSSGVLPKTVERFSSVIRLPGRPSKN